MRTFLAAVSLAALSSTSALALTPTEILDANHAATGGSAWDTKRIVRLDFSYSGQGLTGIVSGTSDLRDGRFIQDFAIGPQTGANGFDGTHVWNKDNAGIVTLQEGGDAIPLAVNNAYRNANLWWAPDRGGATVSADGEKTDDGHDYDVLTIVPKGGKAFDAWFDANSHLLYRIAEAQGNVMTTTTTTNYRAFDGTMQAVDTAQSTGDAKYDQYTKLTKVTFLDHVDPLFYAPPPSAAADFSISGNAHSVTFPIALINNHIHADVMIDGKGPYSFIFDTGGVNLITPELASSLNISIQGKSEARGAGDATMESGLAHVDSIALGNATIKNQLFVTLPLDSLYPSGGEHMPGMVGYETFRRFVTCIDYGNKTMTLIDPKYFDPKDSGTPMKIAFNGNAAIVAGSYDGIPGKFQIDTGARSGLTLDAPFVAANNLGAKLAKGVDAVDGWGVGGASRSHVTRGAALVIGDSVRVDHPVVGLGADKKGAFADPSLSGNIGGGVLKRFVVTFDYGHNIMYLKPVNGPIADLDTYDRAGMWFNVYPEGFKVIDVTKGGPAEAAGVKVGDLITAVDGKPDPALPDIRYRLRNDPVGTVVTFTIARDGKPTTLNVTLADQI